MTELLLINPNMVFPGEASISGRAVPIRDIEKVVNLGLLSIASYLYAKDISLKLIDLVGSSDDMAVLQEAIIHEKPKIVGISCISCFAYPKVLAYAELIKHLDKDIFIMVGGQHISGIPQIAMQESPHLDCVVRGEGEYICHQIITHLKEGKPLTHIPSVVSRDHDTLTDNTAFRGEKVNLDELPFLKYDLYPDFQKYSPHVEISRWCAFGCNFCTSSSMSNGIVYKSIPRFVEELAYVKSTYGEERTDLKFFFACSTFGLKRSRIEELIHLMKERDLNISWRTETRSDAPVVDYLEELTQVGLSVIDLGLESGSPLMLKLMNKCKDPERYLAKARTFIRKAGSIEDLLLKINLVFYAGEAPHTICETLSFLMEHAPYIDTMSAGPVVIYSGVPLETMLSEYSAKYGTSLVKGDFWDKVHAYPVNPSAHFSFEQLNTMALMMAKMFCPEKEYFEVKQYGQYPLEMTLDDFRKEISSQKRHHLPFHFELRAEENENADIPSYADLFN